MMPVLAALTVITGIVWTFALSIAFGGPPDLRAKAVPYLIGSGVVLLLLIAILSAEAPA